MRMPSSQDGKKYSHKKRDIESTSISGKTNQEYHRRENPKLQSEGESKAAKHKKNRSARIIRHTISSDEIMDCMIWVEPEIDSPNIHR